MITGHERRPIRQHPHKAACRKCSCTTSSGRYAKPRPARAEFEINGIALNASGPSTRTFSSRPSLANGQDQRPPEVGSRRLMQAWLVRSCGVSGQGRSGEVGRRTDKSLVKIRPNP